VVLEIGAECDFADCGSKISIVGFAPSTPPYTDATFRNLRFLSLQGRYRYTCIQRPGDRQCGERRQSCEDDDGVISKTAINMARNLAFREILPSRLKSDRQCHALEGPIHITLYRNVSLDILSRPHHFHSSYCAMFMP
jgi:hypothetical protein